MADLRSKTVIVEGPDRAGKSTLVQSLHRARGKRDLIYDRSYITELLYDGHEDEMLKMMRDFMALDDSHLIVLLIDYQTHYHRASLTGHVIDTQEDYATIFKYYKEYGELMQKEFPEKVTILDGTLSPDAIVKACMADLEARDHE